MKIFKSHHNRDWRKFNHLFKEYSGSIYKFVYGLTGNIEESKDITQETFLKLYNYLTTDFDFRNPRAWLFRVAANICINHLKREKKFKNIIENSLEDVMNNETKTNKNSVEMDCIRKQELTIIRETLTQLPDKDRIAIMLYQEGFSYCEIAKMIKVKKSSIGVIISRAISKLEKKICNSKMLKN